MVMILAGDIGGTNSRLALFGLDAGKLALQAHADYHNKEFAMLDAIVGRFLKENNAAVTLACFGIAGPVIHNAVKTSNLPWQIEGDAIRARFGFERVLLINDLVAYSYGIPELSSGDFVCLNPGAALEGGNRAVIAAGTGLGEAGVTWDGARYVPFATEGGHSDFAPTSELQTKLYLYLLDRFGHVSVERVVSGQGIENIYKFLRDTHVAEEPAELADEMQASPNAAAVISKHGLAHTYPICEQTLDIFATIYGAEAGNLALKIMATGGVYIGGGIAPKLITKLREPRFMKAFSEKGRMQALLAAMPVNVVMNDHTGLIGAAAFARDTAAGSASTRA